MTNVARLAFAVGRSLLRRISRASVVALTLLFTGASASAADRLDASASPPAANPTAPSVEPKPPGLVALADGDVSIRLRPVLQLDARVFVEGGVNTFLARRVRPALEATLFELFELRITPELAGTPGVVDAYANVKLLPGLQLRAGKMKAPVGLERLQSDTDLAFVERGLVTALVPDRDVGVMVHGELLGGTLSYAGGVFDGAADGQQIDVDVDDRKDLVGRVFIKPFATTSSGALRRLGVGVAGTSGQHSGPLPAYKTAGQVSFFSFSADAIAGGSERRVVPQASWYVGPLGLFAEYARISESVRGARSASTVNAHAWSVTASFIVTGEDADYSTLQPSRRFSPRRGTFGAVELDARVGRLEVGAEAFDRGLADGSKVARKATEVCVGVQWHFAPAIKLVVDAFRTTLSGGGARDGETVVISRLQLAY